jgi:hypothetical protein
MMNLRYRSATTEGATPSPYVAEFKRVPEHFGSIEVSIPTRRAVIQTLGPVAGVAILGSAKGTLDAR